MHAPPLRGGVATGILRPGGEPGGQAANDQQNEWTVHEHEVALGRTFPPIIDCDSQMSTRDDRSGPWSGTGVTHRDFSTRRARAASIEEIGERNGGIGVFGAEFLGLPHTVTGAAPGSARVGIEDPDVGDSEIEVVLDPLAHLGKPVVFGEDLDTDQGRRAEDLLGRSFRADANIRYAEPGRRHLHALFGRGVNPPLFPMAVIECGDCSLQTSVVEFAYIALQKHAIHVVTIGTVAGSQVLVNAYQ